jgi:hypothetical protein
MSHPGIEFFKTIPLVSGVFVIKYKMGIMYIKERWVNDEPANRNMVVSDLTKAG